MKKKNKILVFFSAVLLTITCFFGITACTSEDSSGKQYSNEEIERIPSIVLNENEFSLEIGTTFELIATLTNIEAEIVWSCADTTIASVNNGMVTAAQVGTTTVVATAKENGKEVSASCTITVYDLNRVAVLYLNYEEIEMEIGTEISLYPELLLNDEILDAVYTYQSGDAEIITVNGNGKITAVHSGETSVTVQAKCEGENFFKTIPVTVKTVPEGWKQIETQIIVPESETGRAIYACEEMPTLSPYVIETYKGTKISQPVEVAYYVSENESWTALEQTPSLVGKYKAVFSCAGNEIYAPSEQKEVLFSILDKKEYCNELLKFETKDAMNALVSGTAKIDYKESADANGGYAVCVNMDSSSKWRTAEIDFQSHYKLSEIESIQIRFAMTTYSNIWRRVAFNVNGIADTDDEYLLLSLGRQADYGEGVYVTKTFTKATLMEAGIAEDDYLQKVIIDLYSGDLFGRIWIDSITINAVKQQTPEEAKAELTSLLKFESEAAMTSLVSGMTQIAYESSANADGGYAVKLNMNSGENRKATIDLKSLYQLKEIESIEIKFAFSGASNTWSRFAFNVNGVAQDTDTDAEYMLLSLGRQADYGENVYVTKTFTKETLIEAGMTEEDYLENVIIENLPGVNVAAYIWIDGITINVVNEEPETNLETQKAELASLLKFESESAMTSLISGMTQIAYESSANADGGYAVKLNMNSGENRKATIDLKSLYQLKEIESIEIKFAFSGASNTWSRFAFNVNGVAQDTDTDAEYMLLSLGRQADYGENVYVTKTFTKETLIEAGMTEEDYLENVIIENLPGVNVAAYIWIDSITIHLAAQD